MIKSILSILYMYKKNNILIKTMIKDGIDSTQTLDNFEKFPSGSAPTKTWECPSPFGYTYNSLDLSRYFSAPYIDYINTSEQSYPIPSGVKKLKVICIGGGGSSGRRSFFYFGTAGQSGAIIIGEIDVSTGNTYTVKTRYNSNINNENGGFYAYNAVFRHSNSHMIAYGGGSGVDGNVANGGDANSNKYIVDGNYNTRTEPNEDTSSVVNGTTSYSGATIVYNSIGTRNVAYIGHEYTNTTGGVVPISSTYPFIPNVGRGRDFNSNRPFYVEEKDYGEPAGVRVYFIY
jgi:hypothetical protein